MKWRRKTSLNQKALYFESLETFLKVFDALSSLRPKKKKKTYLEKEIASQRNMRKTWLMYGSIWCNNSYPYKNKNEQNWKQEYTKTNRRVDREITNLFEVTEMSIHCTTNCFQEFKPLFCFNIGKGSYLHIEH